MDLQVHTDSESNHVWYSLITLSDDTDLKPLMTALSLMTLYLPHPYRGYFRGICHFRDSLSWRLHDVFLTVTVSNILAVY